MGGPEEILGRSSTATSVMISSQLAAITSSLGSDGVQSTDNTNAHNLGLFLKVGFPSSHPQFWQELQNAGSK